MVIGTRPERPPGTSDEQWKALSQEKAEQWEDQARLSRNSKILRDPSSGHDIHVENPRLVARAIEEVVDAASKGLRLVP